MSLISWVVKVSTAARPYPAKSLSRPRSPNPGSILSSLSLSEYAQDSAESRETGSQSQCIFLIAFLFYFIVGNYSIVVIEGIFGSGLVHYDCSLAPNHCVGCGYLHVLCNSPQFLVSLPVMFPLARGVIQTARWVQILEESLFFWRSITCPL